MADFMAHISREKMLSKTDQFLTSFDWDFRVVTVPAVVYYPGEMTLRTRATGIVVPKDPDNTPMSVQMRGFRVIQPGLTENTGQFTLNLQDFEDQSIAAWLLDWQYKCNDPETRASYKKEDLMLDCDIYRLNNSRKPVKQWICRGCLPASGDVDDTMSNEKNPVGATTLQLEVEWFKVVMLNLPK